MIGIDGGGLNFFDPKTGKFQRMEKGLKTNNVLHISRLDKTRYWVSTWNGGLNILDINSKKIIHLGQNTPYDIINAFCVMQVKQGIFWIATYDDGLLAYDIKSKNFTSIVPQSITSSTMDIKMTNKGEVFVASFSGLLYFQTPTSDYQLYYKIPEKSFLSVTKLFIDHSQNIWLGGTKDFIGNINLYRKKFNSLSSNTPYSQLPANSNIAGKKQDRIYFSTRKELVEYDIENKRYQFFKKPSSTISSIIRTHKNNAIICSGFKKLYILNPKKGAFTPLMINTNNYPDFNGLYNVSGG